MAKTNMTGVDGSAIGRLQGLLPVQAFVLRATILLFAVVSFITFAEVPARAQFDLPVAMSVRVAGDEQASRIIMSFDKKVEASTQLLDHPWRLVVDFPAIGYGFEDTSEDWTGFAEAVRWGDMSEEHSRMIFEMEQPFAIAGVSSAEENGRYSLVIDLQKAEPEAFRTAMLDQMRTSSVVVQSTKSDRLGTDPVAGNTGRSGFTVVLDAGHGGIDSGAVGRHRTLEKDVVLAFTQTLKAELENYDGIEVVLTRDDDVFLPLNERVTIARQNNASLFVSLHADSIRQSDVRGATVYTISEKASDSVAASIAESENRSDAIAGINIDDEPGEVADILIDLARRETLGFSVQFARLVVSSVRETTNMIKNPHRFAGFRVLRAPDVPSVLVELGYLSNSQDEAQLRDAKWRADVAESLAAAIARFAQLSGREVALRDDG